MSTKSPADWMHKVYPKTCAPDDYWSQVKRTVHGAPVGEDQLELIEHAIVAGLQLDANDHLLDLCCGNGALSTRIFQRCRGGLGVDFSDYLIEVARDIFANQQQRYIVQDVVAFCSHTECTEDFTKACCYGAFCYLAPAKARQVLFDLKRRFRHLQRVFLGNIADRTKLKLFFDENSYKPGIENDAGSAVGYWWQPDALIDVAKDCGWNATVNRMPPEFYAAHYRYDVTLTPR